MSLYDVADRLTRRVLKETPRDEDCGQEREEKPARPADFAFDWGNDIGGEG